jgi:hypothetical protein
MEKLQLEKSEFTLRKRFKLRQKGINTCVVYDSHGQLKCYYEQFRCTMGYTQTQHPLLFLDTQLDKESFKALVKEFSVNPVTDDS